MPSGVIMKALGLNKMVKLELDYLIFQTKRASKDQVRQ